jgi:long-subunit acyl-CoA synthetase (AMP-forming)
VLKLFTAVSFRGSFKTIFLLTNCPYSRTCIGKYKYCDWGNSSFPESLQSIASDLEKATLILFFAVPRIWTKFQEKKIGEDSTKKLSTKIPVVNSIIKKNYNRN